MSEKVNFLNLNETKDIKNTTTNKTVAESKKEGMSLFDSLLANSTKENKKSEEKSSTNTKTLAKKEEITTEKKDLELKKNSSKAEEKSEVSSKKTVETKPQETAQKETALKDENTQENKKPAKKTTGSLLDRLVLEANKKINKKEEISVKDNSLDSSSIDEKRNTQKQTSLFDTLKQENKETKEEKTEQVKDTSLEENKESKENKEIKEAKKEIVENKDLKEDTKEIKKSEKNRLEETKNDKNLKEIKGKIETKEEKIEQVKDTSLEENKESKENKENKEIKQTQNSLMDELINKAKGEISNKETAKEDLKKEPKIENQNKFEIEQKVINPKKEEATKTEKVEIKSEKVEIKAEIKPEAKKEVGLENRVEAKELKEEATKTEKVEIKSEIKIDLNSEKVEKSGAKIEINKESGNLKNLDEKALVKGEQKVEVSKEKLNKNEGLESKVEQKDELKQESPKPKSLMDELLKTKETKTISGDAITSSPKEANKNSDFLTNIYLGAQKNSIYNQMLSTKSEGVKTVKEGESLEDIKKGAEKLELNPKDLSLKKEEKSSNSSTSKVDSKLQENQDSENNQLETKHVEKKVQRDSIDRMIFDQNAKRNISSSEAVLSNSIENKQEQSVSLSVSPTLALSIQNRIIGAQQQMSSMMSDIARNMYENYKPPITAFRINLFPAQLGQIAILMKSENNGSGLSISMNMSNAATLDAVIENQNSLREAINRNFDNQTDVSFDFGMQSENQGGSFSQNNQEQQQKEQHSSSEIIETVNENKNLTDDLNYF